MGNVLSNNNNNVNNNNIQSNWNQHVNTFTTKRCRHAAVAIDEHRILITGGDNGKNGDTLSSVEIFDVTNETTTTVRDMNETRSYHQTVKYKNDVFVIGGKSGNFNHLNTVEKININNLSLGWTQMSAMNEIRYRFAAALYGEYIYSFGGFNGRTTLSSVERYDIQNDKWEMVNSNMNMKRRYHAAVTVGNKIYIIGGYNENAKELLDSMEIFDVSSNTFQQGVIPNLPIALSHMSAISIGKWIVVTGGSNNEHIHIADSYVYDTEQDVWKGDIKCLKLNVARAEQTATVLGGDTIYIFGGNSNRNRLDSIEYISFKDLTGISTDEQNVGETIVPPEGCEIMLSFNDESAGPDAEELAKRLTRNGHPTFCTRLYCRTNAGNWRRVTIRGTQDCKYYIPLMTKGWQQSNECQFETELIVNRMACRNVIIIPVYYKCFDEDYDKNTTEQYQFSYKVLWSNLQSVYCNKYDDREKWMDAVSGLLPK